MRSTEECVRSALRREAQMRARRSRLVSAATVGLCALAALIVIIPLVPSGMGTGDLSVQGLFGASLFGDSVGSYVLAGLVSCVLAVAITLALVRRRDRTKDDGPR